MKDQEIVKLFSNRIKEGLEGIYTGLPNGFVRLNKYIYGIQRKRYYLMGGLSGAGKTTIADFMLLRALDYAYKNNIKITVFYYSFEIDKDTKIANILSCHIFNKYKKVIPPQKILGLGTNRLSEEEQKIVNNELPYINILFGYINFRFEPMNPTAIQKELYNHFKNEGEFIKEKYIKLDDYGKEVEHERIIRYDPNDPESYTLCVLDHIALCKNEKNFSLKENIDKMSEYIIFLRNICYMTGFIVQQFNQGLILIIL